MEIKICQFIDDHVNEMIMALSKLVAIPSVRGTAEKGLPYGKEPARALETMLDMAKAAGFTVRNHENYVGTIDLDPEKETTLGVLCHLDVVPEGTGWKYPPYTLTLSGGKLYGRGTADDKGPAVAVFFALRALRECGYELSQNVRFIVGCDEECGSSDLRYYREKEALPPRVFTPDSSFPVINLEKGMIRGSFIKACDAVGAKTILSASGGTVVNAVPERATALVRGFSKDELDAAAATLQKGVTLHRTEEDGSIRLTVTGKSAHASTPAEGYNAVTALFGLLAALPAEDGTATLFASLSKLFPYGETDGKSVGVAAADEKSGALTLVLSMLSFADGKLEARFDSRFPICTTEQKLRTKLERTLAKYGFVIDEFTGVAPHYVNEDSDFVRTLLSSYTEISHKRGYCVAVGGGTYVHDVEGGVAFGAEFPGVDSHMHGADEMISMEHLVTSAKIYAEAILKLCR